MVGEGWSRGGAGLGGWVWSQGVMLGLEDGVVGLEDGAVGL